MFSDFRHYNFPFYILFSSSSSPKTDYLDDVKTYCDDVCRRCTGASDFRSNCNAIFRFTILSSPLPFLIPTLLTRRQIWISDV